MGSFVITLREGFEAALIVCLIFAFLAKTGQLREHGRTIWIGIAGAIGLSVVIGAVLFAAVGELEGTAEATYEGTAMLLAAGVLTWMVFWMRRQAATIGGHLREQVSSAITAGGGIALAAVAFVGVAREGLETALFLFATTSESGALVSFVGAAAGLVAAVALGILFYKGAVKLDLGRFFTITSILVILFAAYLLNGGLHEVGEATGNEGIEEIAPFAALLYGAGFGVLYLRDALRAKPKQPAEAPPPAAAQSDS
jgi:high-affinity iron transporter